MDIAILGFGTVGKGVYEIIEKNNLNYANVKRILRPRNPKEEDLNNEKISSLFCSIDEILNDGSIDTIVECMGGLSPAYDYVKEALEKHKCVVTSNKMLIATYYDELISLSNKMKVALLFEASVGGGIPWIENLTRLGYVDKVSGFKGIINGTTNYILDKMTNENLDFDVALKEAQDLGYAEKDPSSDIDGDDVLYKTIISANVANNLSYELNGLVKHGIRNIKKEDIEYFKERNLVCKLISEYDEKNNLLFVMPELFDKSLGIANVRKNFNHIDVYSWAEGTLSFEGQGAGKLPTAHSILQDIVRIYDHATFVAFCTDKIKVDYKNFKAKFYIRKKDGSKIITDEMLYNDIDFSNVDFIAKVG